MLDGDPAAPPIPLRGTPSRELMQNWSLTLEALGIPAEVIDSNGIYHLFVAPSDEARASAALAAADRDRHAELQARPVPVPDGGRSAAGIAFTVAIAAFHWVTGARDGGDPGGWFRRGAAIAERITGGALERTVTALTLHADWGHVAGNAVAALIFVSALGRWLGGGLALLATVLAGAAGNLIVALAYGRAHNSVGASTATFAALGILGGLQLLRWSRAAYDHVGDRRRRILRVMGACLGVFAMLGVGERSDVLAHLAGLAMGLATGALLGRTLSPPVPRLIDAACGLATAALVAGSWLIAFR